MTTRSFNAIGSLMAVAGLGFAFWLSRPAPATPISPSRTTRPEIRCVGQGQVWYARADGWCYAEDQPLAVADVRAGLPPQPFQAIQTTMFTMHTVGEEHFTHALCVVGSVIWRPRRDNWCYREDYGTPESNPKFEGLPEPSSSSRDDQP